MAQLSKWRVCSVYMCVLRYLLRINGQRAGWVGSGVKLGVEWWRVLASLICSSHQDLFSHLLDLLGFGLNVILQLIFPTLNHLQPFYLILKCLPALLLTQQKRSKANYTENCRVVQLSKGLFNIGLESISISRSVWYLCLPKTAF